MNTTIDAAINRAAQILKAEGAREVYLFGSEAAGTAGATSDVDLAVAGLPPAAYYHAVGIIAGILRRPLDLVDLDEPTPFTEYLKRKGKLRRVA
jgi:predicted nucleotidyltransferase